MKNNGSVPNLLTYNSLINHLGNVGMVKQAKEAETYCALRFKIV